MKNIFANNIYFFGNPTNRVYDSSKPYGIVCYRNIKKKTDEAICLGSLGPIFEVAECCFESRSFFVDFSAPKGWKFCT